MAAGGSEWDEFVRLITPLKDCTCYWTKAHLGRGFDVTISVTVTKEKNGQITTVFDPVDEEKNEVWFNTDMGIEVAFFLGLWGVYGREELHITDDEVVWYRTLTKSHTREDMRWTQRGIHGTGYGNADHFKTRLLKTLRYIRQSRKHKCAYRPDHPGAASHASLSLTSLATSLSATFGAHTLTLTAAGAAALRVTHSVPARGFVIDGYGPGAVPYADAAQAVFDALVARGGKPGGGLRLWDGGGEGVQLGGKKYGPFTRAARNRTKKATGDRQRRRERRERREGGGGGGDATVSEGPSSEEEEEEGGDAAGDRQLAELSAKFVVAQNQHHRAWPPEGMEMTPESWFMAVRNRDDTSCGAEAKDFIKSKGPFSDCVDLCTEMHAWCKEKQIREGRQHLFMVSVLRSLHDDDTLQTLPMFPSVESLFMRVPETLSKPYHRFPYQYPAIGIATDKKNPPVLTPYPETFTVILSVDQVRIGYRRFLGRITVICGSKQHYINFNAGAAFTKKINARVHRD